MTLTNVVPALLIEAFTQWNAKNFVAPYIAKKAWVHGGIQAVGSKNLDLHYRIHFYMDFIKQFNLPIHTTERKTEPPYVKHQWNKINNFIQENFAAFKNPLTLKEWLADHHDEFLQAHCSLINNIKNLAFDVWLPTRKVTLQ